MEYVKLFEKENMFHQIVKHSLTPKDPGGALNACTFFNRLFHHFAGNFYSF